MYPGLRADSMKVSAATVDSTVGDMTTTLGYICISEENENTRAVPDRECSNTRKEKLSSSSKGVKVVRKGEGKARNLPHKIAKKDQRNCKGEGRTKALYSQEGFERCRL